MHWEWVVPVIVLVVWILTNVLRPSEEQNKLQQRRQLPDQEPDGRKPQTEVDRFLEEINRLRRQSAEQTQPQPEQPRPVPRAEPVVPEVRRAPPQVRPQPQPQRRTQEAQARRPEPRRQKTQVAQPVLEVVEALPAAPTVRPKPAPGVRKTASPAVSLLHGLLRNPASMQAAVLLHEVLGPPKSRQRR